MVEEKKVLSNRCHYGFSLKKKSCSLAEKYFGIHEDLTSESVTHFNKPTQPWINRALWDDFSLNCIKIIDFIPDNRSNNAFWETIITKCMRNKPDFIVQLRFWAYH